MKPTFPLYNHLIKKTHTHLLDDNDKTEFVDKVRTLDSNKHELVYAIIRTHQVTTEPGTFYQSPYKSKRQKNGVKFDFDQFPLQLQNILVEFVRMNTI